MAENAQVTIPKAQLPDCQVGEVLEIVGEDKENFILQPQYAEEEEPAAAEGGEDMPAAVKALMA